MLEIASIFFFFFEKTTTSATLVEERGFVCKHIGASKKKNTWKYFEIGFIELAENEKFGRCEAIS